MKGPGISEERIIICTLGMTLLLGGISRATQDPSAAAEEIKAALGPENSGMIPIQQWNLPEDLDGFEIQDVYKHLHQAYLGPGHAIPSREAAESFLKAEWSELGATRSGEELLQLLDWGAPFVRIHLRPYRDRGGTADSLLSAFVRSAEVPTDSTAFASAWDQVGKAIAAGRLPFDPSAFDSLDAVVREAGYPAAHHSERYLHRYRPAYRVVGRRLAEELLQLPDRREADQ